MYTRCELVIGVQSFALPICWFPVPGFELPALRPGSRFQVTCLTAGLKLSGGRRGSKPRPTAWKAVVLPTELLPHNTMPFRFLTINHLLATPHHRCSVGRAGLDPTQSKQPIECETHITPTQSPQVP